ncbi:MAG: GNAT family N-acetyltransferase [Syntrophaceae bacterium]
MITVRVSTLTDYPRWLELAREVEPLFGPMADEPEFCTSLRAAIIEGQAFCASGGEGGAFHGGIVISGQANEILWLAVARQSRGRGTGAALMLEALGRLDHARPVTVTTFAPAVEAGGPARRLYESLGFRDSSPAGLNPAGIPTVIMTAFPPLESDLKRKGRCLSSLKK